MFALCHLPAHWPDAVLAFDQRLAMRRIQSSASQKGFAAPEREGPFCRWGNTETYYVGVRLNAGRVRMEGPDLQNTVTE
ncbi:hypothetical protein VTK26DRAFT_928 [Humicola hyalothermophila]